MILRLYSLFDIKSKVYHPPAFCHNTGHALRFFKTQIQKPGTIMADYPDDFQIYECGAYDDATCIIEGLQNPTLICTLADLLAPDGAETHAPDDNKT